MDNLVELLKENNLTISFAESITGGLLSSLITSISGSSKVFKGSVIAYDIIVKEDILNVSSELINKYSVVSSEVSISMVNGLSNIIDSNIYISTTGNAGPTKQNNTNKFNAFYSIKYLENINTYEVIFSSNDRLNNIKTLIYEINKRVEELIKGVRN